MRKRQTDTCSGSLPISYTTAVVLLALAMTVSAQQFEIIHEFQGADGTYPAGPLLQASDGYLYGVTVNDMDGKVIMIAQLGRRRYRPWTWHRRVAGEFFAGFD